MSVVLSVLGAIFTVILIMLLVILFLVCFLLLCPICYLAEGEYGENLSAKGRVCWLLGLVWVNFAYEDGEFAGKVRVFGMDMQKLLAWREKRKKRKADSRQEKKHAVKKETEKKSVSHVEELTEHGISTAEITEEEVEQKKNFKSIASLRKKIRKKVDWSKELRRFLKSANTRGMVCILKDNVLHLWRKLKPKVLRGRVIFGTGDPCSTGEILGMLAIFYAAYGRGIQITPDFEEARLEGNLFIKGRISLIIIVIILLRILLSGEWSQFRKEAEQLKEAF